MEREGGKGEVEGGERRTGKGEGSDVIMVDRR